MNRPITAPNSRPITSISGMTSHGSHPSVSSAAEATVVSATTPPTDRSIPPEMITRPSPTTRMSRNGVVVNRLKNDWPSRMAVNATTPARKARMNSDTVAPRGRNFRTFARRRVADFIMRLSAFVRAAC